MSMVAAPGMLHIAGKTLKEAYVVRAVLARFTCHCYPPNQPGLLERDCSCLTHIFYLLPLSFHSICIRKYTRKMVPITRRASSCLALALSINLTSLAHLSFSLSCVFFSFFSGSHSNSITDYIYYNTVCHLTCRILKKSLKEQFLVWTFLK